MSGLFLASETHEPHAEGKREAGRQKNCESDPSPAAIPLRFVIRKC